MNVLLSHWPDRLLMRREEQAETELILGTGPQHPESPSCPNQEHYLVVAPISLQGSTKDQDKLEPTRQPLPTDGLPWPLQKF